MDAGRGGRRAGSAPRTPGTPAPSAPRQEARAPEDAARLETGRGGLGEHDGQRQHRHRGLLATRPACRRTPRRPRARSGPPATPARAPPPSAVSFSARPFPRQHTHYLYVTRTPGSVRNAALKINDRRVTALLARVPPDPASAARTARRQGAAERGPPAAEAQDRRFRRCPLPRWRRRGLSSAGRNLGGAVGAGGRDAASGAGPRVDAGGLCAASGSRFEAAVGARSPSACRKEKASLRLGLAARELGAGAPGDALPARLHLQGGCTTGTGPGPHQALHGAAGIGIRAWSGTAWRGGAILRGQAIQERV